MTRMDASDIRVSIIKKPRPDDIHVLLVFLATPEGPERKFQISSAISRQVPLLTFLL